MLFRKFFVVVGKGASNTSRLNAFDKALVEAGIGQCNLVPVSSILPSDATPVDYSNISPGSVTFCVLARKDGVKEEQISAGIAWALIEGEKKKYGIVAEDDSNKTEESVRKTLQRKINEMAEARGMKVVESQTKTTSIRKIEEEYGTVIVALVYAN